MTTVLAVSPHLDDAVFSAGALLARLARRGVRVVVATMFTGNVARPSGFALACQLDKGLGPEVDYMALRRAEDRTACALIGADACHLPLLEAPHRGYECAAALFGSVRDDDPARTMVAEQVRALAEQIQPTWLLGPMGIGGHVDHLIVRDALLQLAHPRTYLWADWPYADRHGLSAPSGSALLGRRMSTTDRAAKAAACQAYASQLGFQFGGRESLASRISAQQHEHFVRQEQS